MPFPNKSTKTKNQPLKLLQSAGQILGLLQISRHWSHLWTLASVLTLVRSRAPASARFFSMSLSQWIRIFSSMLSRPLPRGTSSSSSWDPASCLYNTFTSLNNNNRHKKKWNGSLNGSIREEFEEELFWCHREIKPGPQWCLSVSDLVR